MEENKVINNNSKYSIEDLEYLEDLKKRHFKYVEYVTSEEFKKQHPEHVAYLESEEFKKDTSKYLKYLDSEEAKEIIASIPKYVPEPLVEYDFKPANFDEKLLEELTESIVEYLKYLKRKKPRFHGIFRLMYGE
jgi:hypothetical protein